MAATWISVINLIILLTAVVINHSSSPSSATVTSPGPPESTGAIHSAESSPESTTRDPTNESVTDVSTHTGNSSQQNVTYSPSGNATTSAIDLGGFMSNFDSLNTYSTVFDVMTYASSVPGVIGNILALIVVFKLNEQNNTKLFMVTLTSTDLLQCIWRILLAVFRYYNYANVTEDWICIFLYFPINFTYVYSNFIVCCWTIERFIAVIFPLRMSTLCTSRNTKISLVVAFILALGLDAVYLTEVITFTIPSSFEEYGVIVTCDYTEFFYQVWNYIDTVYYIFIPMIIVCSLNGVICYRIFRMRKKHQSMTSNSDAMERRAQEQRQMTIVLLGISASFIFLHLPILCYLIYEAYVGYYELAVEQGDIANLYLGLICYKSVEFQNAINFILYMATARKFRKKFLSLFCACREESPSLGEQKMPKPSGTTSTFSIATESSSTMFKQD